MKVLSIETSCDETAAAIVEWLPDHSSLSPSKAGQATVLVNIVSSQASLHAKWGGVVPDLASREHIRNIVPVVAETLDRARLSPADIDLIAVTQGPGLMPALVVGVTAAKTLSFVWNKPLIGIQHLEGHIYANFLGLRKNQSPNAKNQFSEELPESIIRNQESIFPLVALVVSGGHTELVLMQDHFTYEILGETQDDACGEAFDKVAKMLGLDYPGGPIVAKRADAFRTQNLESGILNLDPNIKNSKFKNQDSRFSFPRPMLSSDDFNFSFSGLKTAVLYAVKKIPEAKRDEEFIDLVCHEFQEAAVDVLLGKTKKALALYSPATFVIAGGVSANVRLREQLKNLIDTINLEVELPSERISFLTPEFTYSLDNAAMIGIAAALRYERMSASAKTALNRTYLTLEPDANMPFQKLENTY